ncbi:hypothetical protein GUJ93_ZPchr0005g15019 [Zizania palustris]|uniref:KANL3/Tex30 alpha/beta hydrolase-like domain-containing protein n=1 Tax=Zizania palustris TaxID=103762 RepID=A0A8J5VCX3_ZIZPA|nr:hypothetical protein GUJ93_ZPchr0005g15019 [Zizania palustris]
MAGKRRRAGDSSTAPPLRTTPSQMQPVVVFAHGAGAPSSSDWMVRWKDMLTDALDAVKVVTFDYPYLSGGKRRPPPKAEKLVDHHLDVVKDVVAEYPGHPLILMGKSMGSRISCMVANSDDINVSAVVCLGYPLKGVKGAVRDETLLKLKIPTMFVQGSKDGLCPLHKLGDTRKNMTCKNELHVIDGGDHSFKIGKKYQESTGVNQHDAEMESVKAIAQFVQNSIGET